MPARCASSLPLSLSLFLPPCFSLSRFYKRRVLYLSFFHSPSHSLSFSFLLFYITSIFLLQPSSSHCPRPSCLFPIPYVFLRLFSTIFFLFFFPLYISGSLSLRLSFVSFNSDRPFAKCAKRTLMGKRVKRKERGEKERKEGLERDGLIIERSSHRWERCLSVVDCTLNHCNVHRIFDFVAVTTVAPQTEFILIKREEL